MQPADFDLDTLIEDLAQMLRRMIGEHIEFDHLIAGERCVVKADPSQVEQVIINLVLNARDAMPNGGKLQLETRHVFEDGRSTRMGQVIRAGNYAALVVRDAGTGMTREVQTRIFEPFFTTKKTGSGMGLATVYGIVKQSGGYIWADSAPESGSTFTIYLHAAAGVTKTEARAPSPDKPDRSGKALLVEDQEDVQVIARKMLESIGFDVIEASNGDDGLRLAVKHEDSIDILLTDVLMPGMSGLQLADALMTRNQKTKIILMSGCI